MRFTKEELKEFMLKEIEIIQDIIKRMASNSFSIEKMDHCSCYSSFTFKRNYTTWQKAWKLLIFKEHKKGPKKKRA